MTFFFLAATGAWWRHLERPGIAGAALSCLATGLAFGAKFSAVLLVPMLAALGLLWALRPERRPERRAALRRAARSLLLHFATAWLVIWCLYGLRASPFAPAFAEGARFQDSWDSLMPGLGAKAVLLGWIRGLRLLPEAWLHGLAHVLQFSRGQIGRAHV